MFQTFISFVFLFITWVILSGYFDAFFLISGALSCLFAILVARRLGIKGCESCVLFYTWRGAKYFLWLIKEIIVSSVDVAKRVWQIEPDISPTIAWIHTEHTNDVGRTLFANSITLTPGTVSMLTFNNKICVHALCAGGITALQEGTMDRKTVAVAGNSQEQAEGDASC